MKVMRFYQKLPYRQLIVEQYASLALPNRQVGNNISLMNIGHVIRILRVQQGLTQEELALEAQVATSNVSRIENGQRQPSQRLLKRLASALGTSVSHIHGLSEEGLFPSEDRNSVASKVMFVEDIAMDTPARFNKNRAESLSPEVLTLLKYFQQLSPENKTLALEHIKLLNRMQRNELDRSR